MSLPFLSICVPSFNRATQLPLLYNSLLAQERFDFELVVADDGSRDNTLDLLAQWKREAPFEIAWYGTDENLGKASAIRRAIQHARGTFTVLMDSDDYFLPGVFEALFQRLESILGERRTSGDRPLAGLCYQCVRPDGTLIGSPFPRQVMETNHVRMATDFGVKGDKKEIVLTELLKESLFPEELMDRRVTSGYFWVRISRTHDIRFIDDPIAVKDYLPGGISANLDRIRMGSPTGSMLVYLEQLALGPEIYRSFGARVRAAANAWRYRLHGGRESLTPWVRVHNAAPFLIGLPIGAALCARDYIRLRR